MQEALAWAVRLDPFAIDYKLRNRSLAYVLDDLIRGARLDFDIDFGIGNLVFLEESFGFAAITAPWSGVDQHMHLSIIPGNSRGRP